MIDEEAVVNLSKLLYNRNLTTETFIYNLIILKCNMVLTKTRAVGGSLIVTIPKEVVEKERLRENELVEINLKKIKISGFGICKGLDKFKKEDEFDI